MRFKVGDKVVCIDATGVSLTEGATYTVVGSIFEGDFLKVEGFSIPYDCDRFLEAPPELETELRLCESRKRVLSERIGMDQEEEKSLEKRIQELQQAIKKRDKPKGRVGLKDSILEGEDLYFVTGCGSVVRTSSTSKKAECRAMANLFYDKESAERAVHDRKQRVLRGEDV